MKTFDVYVKLTVMTVLKVSAENLKEAVERAMSLKPDSVVSAKVLRDANDHEFEIEGVMQ